MTESICIVCGAREDTRLGVCYGCATKREAKGCEERGYHEYDDRPNMPFYDRCVWCDLPRGLAGQP